MTDVNASRAVVPILDTDNGWLTVAVFDVEYDSPFWLAPPIYCGNRLSSYGSNVTYSVTWVVMRGDTSGKPTTGPNVILVVSIQSALIVTNGRGECRHVKGKYSVVEFHTVTHRAFLLP